MYALHQQCQHLPHHHHPRQQQMWDPMHVLIWNISSSRPYLWSVGWTNTEVDNLLLGSSLFQKFGSYGGLDVNQLLGRKVL